MRELGGVGAHYTLSERIAYTNGGLASKLLPIGLGGASGSQLFLVTLALGLNALDRSMV
jgi:hypothetical protein